MSQSSDSLRPVVMLEEDPGIPFPYEAYPSQRELMNAIYSLIERGRIGLLESPTGTGKTLSALCACLHWLVRNELHDSNNGNVLGSGGKDDVFQRVTPEQIVSAKSFESLLDHTQSLGDAMRLASAWYVLQKYKSSPVECSEETKEQSHKLDGKFVQNGAGSCEPDWLLELEADLQNKQVLNKKELSERINAFFETLYEAPLMKRRSVTSSSELLGAKRTPANNSETSIDHNDELIEDEDLITLKRQHQDLWDADSVLTASASSGSSAVWSTLRSLMGASSLAKALQEAVAALKVQSEATSDAFSSVTLDMSTLRKASMLENLLIDCKEYLSKTSSVNASTSGALSSTLSLGYLPGANMSTAFGLDPEASPLSVIVRALEQVEGVQRPQIIYCSRTHTQLVQVTDEFKLLRRTSDKFRDLRVVSLASRNRLCTNGHVQNVAKHSESSTWNELCRTLREKGNSSLASLKSNSTSSKELNVGCDQLKPSGLLAMRSKILSEPMDIETLLNTGCEMNTCAYYASRSAVSAAHLLIVPYSMVFHAATRKSMGLCLENAVLVVDEAHNFSDAVSASEGVSITEAQLSETLFLLQSYIDRLSSRCSAASLQKVRLLRDVAASILAVLLDYSDQFDRKDKSVQASSTISNEESLSKESLGSAILKQSMDRKASNFGNSIYGRMFRPAQAKNVDSNHTKPKSAESAETKTPQVSSHLGHDRKMMFINEFLRSTKHDHVNLSPLINWATETRLVHRIQGAPCNLQTDPQADKPGYPINVFHNSKRQAGASAKDKGGHGSETGPANSAIRTRRISNVNRFLSFISGLTRPSDDARVIMSAPEGKNSTPQTPKQTNSEQVSDNFHRVNALFCSGMPPYSPPEISNSEETMFSIHFVLLSISESFAEAVQTSKSVIFLGGTLRPFNIIAKQLVTLHTTDTITKESEVKDLQLGAKLLSLRPRVPTSVIETLVSAHVIPKTNVAAFAVGEGAGSNRFVFTHDRGAFKMSGDPSIIHSLGSILLDIVRVSPGGVVVFLPSYSAENNLSTSLQQTMCTRTGMSYWDSLMQIKRVLREPTSPTKTALVWQKYTQSIYHKSNSDEMKVSFESDVDKDDLKSSSLALGELESNQKGRSEEDCIGVHKATQNGAIMFCVMGGKFSEGLNFKDDLARTICVLGMPYPPPNDILVSEQRRKFDKVFPNQKMGDMFYDSLCMRKVNQAIGRGIRHAHDYAAILLIDARYTEKRIASQLSNWVQDALPSSEMNWGEILHRLQVFFSSVKQVTLNKNT